MNDHLPQAIREALAPFAPPVESLNDDDAYVVDMGRNCIVRQCSAALLRSGGSIPVGLNQAVMTGMHARHHIAYEQERRAKLGKVHTGILEEVCRIQTERDALLEALKFYADGHHFNIADEDAWDTVSGEPKNLWCDEAGTATVEDGSIAKDAIAKATGVAHVAAPKRRVIYVCPVCAASLERQE